MASSDVEENPRERRPSSLGSNTSGPSNGGESPEKRRKRLLGIFAVSGSVCSLISGLVTVILVLHYRVVPLITTASLQRAVCYVSAIDRRHVKPSRASADDSDIPVWAANDSTDLCSIVRVKYVNKNGFLTPGYLMDYPLKPPGMSSKCHLAGLPGSLTDPSPRRDAPMWSRPRTLTTGQKVRCFKHRHATWGYHEYRTVGDRTREQLTIERSNNLKIKLKYILPPTTLFIIGFVGLFFSCVYCQLQS